mmetsp:Transcript_29468/g.70665  ORF Transcript_29468/g.70665 Transcript_29468/m.70665 type:complete len:90 (-) Transcript_29468:843-1112(-)
MQYFQLWTPLDCFRNSLETQTLNVVRAKTQIKPGQPIKKESDSVSGAPRRHICDVVVVEVQMKPFQLNASCDFLELLLHFTCDAIAGEI